MTALDDLYAKASKHDVCTCPIGTCPRSLLADIAHNELQGLVGALEKIAGGEIPEAVKAAGLFPCLSYFETIAALSLARIERLAREAVGDA